MTITPEDILAAIDVLRQVANEADDSDLDVAFVLRDACQELIIEAKSTISILESEMLRQVEAAPRRVGRTVLMSVNDKTERFDHDQIEAAVINAAVAAAVDKTTGEIDPREAARQAAHMMKTVYVSPSSKAKKTALPALGVEPADVMSAKVKGRKLHEVEQD